MDRVDRQAAPQALWSMALTLALGAALGFSATVLAADYPEFVDRPPIAAGPPAPRFFPRAEGESDAVLPPLPPPRRYACAPRRAPVPTDAPDDPSYVGSEYGLSKPSYYGFRPPPGVGDPSGRPLR